MKANQQDHIYFIHGWGVGVQVMSGQAEILSAQWQTHLLALPGYDQYGCDKVVPDIERYAETLAGKIKPGSIIAGWSLGGMVTLALAKQCKTARAVVLLASTPCFVKKPDWAHGIKPARIENMMQRLRADPEQVTNEFLQLTAAGEEFPGDIRQKIQKCINKEKISPTILMDGLHILLYTDLRATLAELSCPVLLILGENDRLISKSSGPAAQKIQPRLRLEYISRTGHAPFISRPEISASIINNWLMAVLHEPV